MRVLKDLVQLKESYPDRVHLILGNRDINKLRMQFSLHPTILKSLPLVKWLKAPPEATVGTDYKLSDPESKMKWVSFFSVAPSMLIYLMLKHHTLILC